MAKDHRGADDAERPIPAWLDGVLTPVGKLEVHQRGLRHKAVSVFVLRDGLLLLQRRAAGKYHTPGLWANTCCTHPDWDESGADCAVRRLREELGIEGLEVEPRGTVEYRADVGGGLTEHEVVEMFAAQAPDGLEVRPDPAEVMEVRWIAPEALADEVAARPEAFVPWLRIYLDRHAAMIFGD
ncbi:isopentenyl-diphosphate Delta-isomerase [Wenxinia marina]|uniref:Isopentenyl-diphosphate Delta-isomerase n=1 Tax=Wenxinia marina DSM 24838 TaxID=1123501 RepID=A0A0D0QIB2_9RHOB|nr:isopentenyl-diphosphate Delta-isomerase [Wenxinia marina]KIQ70773.1 isopentenyl-diphosphate delta-isomerase [Wenxinia marina DSM 24838]GGL80266.1 isopentenyl-diphosphate Delta-isomerase [Wenxinia marina]